MKFSDLEASIKKTSQERDVDTKIYYLDRMVEDIKNGYFCVFAGAGLSASSGYVNWKTLLAPMGKQLGLNLNIDLTILAQYYANTFTRDELNRRILEEFAKIPQNNENMDVLASMPIRRYWTTNYDSIIEDTLQKHNKIVDVVTDQLQFKYHTPGNNAMVIKMHGDKKLPDKAVLCKDDYENYDENRAVFTQSLVLDLISNTFLFIGFSFSDPNLDRIIGIVKRNFKGATLKKHYCFLKKVSIKDYISSEKDDIPNSVIEQFQQDYNMQEYKITDMRNYGIETILIDDFDQITHMLRYMKDKLNLNSIFISGATKSEIPNNYGNFDFSIKDGENDLGMGAAESFITQLADDLITNQYKIITGFGIGVGTYVVAGAYARNENKRSIKLDEQIYIQPLISVEDKNSDRDKRELIKDELRDELIKKCGIVITLFGKSDEQTKQDDIKKDGTYIEYQKAKQEKKIIIPVGATGFTSKIIYDEEKCHWIENINIYNDLGKRNSSLDLRRTILKCIELKKKEKELKLRARLLKFFEKKYVFVSFHFQSSFDNARKLIDVINKCEKYSAVEELEKKSDNEIKDWINDKMSDISAVVVIFNECFLSSQWTNYEIGISIDKNIPILFLIDSNNNSCNELKQYISIKK